MNFRLKISFLFLTCFALAKAQAVFVPAYLVTAKGDTLKGEAKINPKKEFDNYSKIQFKDASGAQKNYKPNKVKGYGFDKKHFVAMGEDEDALFYERMATGAIILYRTTFESVHMNETIKEFAYYLFKEGDKKVTEVKELKFKKQLQEWMADAPEIAGEYTEEKKFNPESALAVINKYNARKSGN
jgi:hypothetical protein